MYMFYKHILLVSLKAYPGMVWLPQDMSWLTLFKSVECCNLDLVYSLTRAYQGNVSKRSALNLGALFPVV